MSTAPVPTAPATEQAPDREALAERTEHLLQAHVPLTLLLDLAATAVPESTVLYAAEGGDAAWARR